MRGHIRRRGNAGHQQQRHHRVPLCHHARPTGRQRQSAGHHGHGRRRQHGQPDVPGFHSCVRRVFRPRPARAPVCADPWLIAALAALVAGCPTTPLEAGASFQLNFRASGGGPPYSCAVAGSAVAPNGSTVFASILTDAFCVVTGTPDAGGTLEAVIFDGAGASVALNNGVGCPVYSGAYAPCAALRACSHALRRPALTSVECPANLESGSNLAPTAVAVIGGDPVVACSLVGVTGFSGLSVTSSAATGYVCIISGTPTATGAGPATFSIKVIDGANGVKTSAACAVAQGARGRARLPWPQLWSVSFYILLRLTHHRSAVDLRKLHGGPGGWRARAAHHGDPVRRRRRGVVHACRERWRADGGDRRRRGVAGACHHPFAARRRRPRRGAHRCGRRLAGQVGRPASCVSHLLLLYSCRSRRRARHWKPAWPSPHPSLCPSLAGRMGR